MSVEGEDARPTRSRQIEEKRADRRHTLLTALAAGALAIVASIATAGFQNYAAVEVQAAQFREERSAADREKREDAYFSFLAAANDYAVATADVKDCLEVARAMAAPDGSFQVEGECGAKVVSLGPLRAEFESALARVYVFGSSRSADQAAAVSGTLPASFEDDVNNSLPDLSSNGFTLYDESLFVVNYRGFQFLMCQELPAQPRDDC